METPGIKGFICDQEIPQTDPRAGEFLCGRLPEGVFDGSTTGAAAPLRLLHYPPQVSDDERQFGCESRPHLLDLLRQEFVWHLCIDRKLEPMPTPRAWQFSYSSLVP